MAAALGETPSNDQPEATAATTSSATDPTTVFANAFTSNSNSNSNNLSLSSANQVVKIVDQSAQGRGNVLVAVRSIPRGQVIYTERAAVASQIPKRQRRRRRNEQNSSPETSHDGHDDSESLWSVRACQYCFRSLEPASSCQGLFATFENDTNNNSNNQQQEAPTLPHTYLWPVPGPVEGSRFLQKEVHAGSPCRRDEFGHLVCCRGEMQVCHALFCSMTCHDRFQHELGSCCNITASMHALLDLLQTRRRVNENDNADDADDADDVGSNEDQQHNNPPNKSNDGNDENDNDNDMDEETTGEVQEPVVLAIRIFALSLQHFRQTKTLHGTCLDGLCGESSDVTPLELGWTHEQCSAMGWIQEEECNAIKKNGKQQGQESTASGRYTLKPLYDCLVSIWCLTETEQQAISLDRFHLLACMAARNAFDFQTQNPFDVYYSALIRSTGGRNSVNHPAIMAQVSRALGCQPPPPSSTSTTTTNSSDSSFGLQRGMDSRIRERVTPEIVAIFPLTARINHSCHPNAYIASQMFVDAHMDLVAIQDVLPGEEITNSYIYTGHSRNMASSLSSRGTSMIQRIQGGKPRHKRQRELQAKYLFLCHCPLCATP